MTGLIDKNMTERRILFIMTAVLPLSFALSCTKAERGGADRGIEKEICITVADRAQTKTQLSGYDINDTNHKVRWNAGDRIWCYSESGIYMDYTLTAEDVKTNIYEGDNANAHIVYRYGDEWTVCYCAGAKIGEYVGARKKDLLVLGGGIPRVQSGRFEDCHVCLVRENPEHNNYVFENMQAFLRFEVTQSGSVSDGTLLGQPVTEITVQSIAQRDKMAGNLQIMDESGWRTSLQDSGNDADRIISVIPDGGRFIPASDYFVAVPARRYGEGLRFILYTGTGSSKVARGFVDLSAATTSRNQILDCHDLLKFCAIYVTGISLNYGPETAVENTGITIALGHSGKLVPVITPETATDLSLQWSVSDDSVCSVAQDGTVTALKTGSCTVTCTAKDGSGVNASVEITVSPDAGLGGGEYDDSDFTW